MSMNHVQHHHHEFRVVICYHQSNHLERHKRSCIVDVDRIHHGVHHEWPLHILELRGQLLKKFEKFNHFMQNKITIFEFNCNSEFSKFQKSKKKKLKTNLVHMQLGRKRKLDLRNRHDLRKLGLLSMQERG